MTKLIEFSHAPLADGVNETQLIEAMLRFETEALVPRTTFSLHALLRSMSTCRYAHLVAVDDPAALARFESETEQLASFRELGRCLDVGAMVMQHHRPLSPFRAPDRFAALELGTFRLAATIPATVDAAAALDERARTLREDYLQRRPEHLAQVITSLGNGEFAELTFADSLAHMQQTCAGYVHEPSGRALLELVDADQTSIDYWLPLLVRDLNALPSRRAA